MNRVLIVSPDSPTTKMFSNEGWGVITDGEDPDLVCFTGGADINPKVYGEEPNGAYGWNDKRDEMEVGVYNYTLKWGIPMVGICRGGQLLNVLNGGKMLQHIDGHLMGTRPVKYWNGKTVLLHEDHHQGMIAGPDGIVLATDIRDGNHEIIWYPKTRCLCFQAHPEWGHDETRELFFQLIQQCIGES